MSDVAEARRMPTYAELSVAMNRLMTARDREWCGVPMPLPGLGLVLESKNPHRELLRKVQAVVDMERPPEPARACTDEDMTWQFVNQWRGYNKQGAHGDVVVCRNAAGRTTWYLDAYAPRRNKLLFGPLESFDAWNIDTECTAIDRLATLVTERAFKAYVLTGSFLWRSKRSDVMYLFRRCRPTVAMTSRPGFGGEDVGMRVLACLCLHPIGYYARTFAGAMTPTDDVIAHYLLAAGDEPLFWRRAEQHHPATPESGL
jgi:hypothetical protein